MPVAQLAEAAEWRFETPRIVTKLLDILGPQSAEGAAPQVICVPQLPTDPLVPHETWSGEPAVLKGVAVDEDGNLSGGTYYWELGDGTSTPPASISNADNLSVIHSYTAAPGSLFVARLHVTDAAGESSSDEYRVLVKARTLDVEVNKAINDGLWWLYLNRQDMGAAGCRWTHSSSYVANSTASAVQSFEINGYLETGDPEENPYAEAVRGGIDYLTTRIASYNIGNQTYGNPDATATESA